VQLPAKRVRTIQSQDLESGGDRRGDARIGILHHQRRASSQQLGCTKVWVWGGLQVGNLHSADKRFKGLANSGALERRLHF